jgi:hypothetical protein
MVDVKGDMEWLGVWMEYESPSLLLGFFVS